MASSLAFASLILWTLLAFQSFGFGHSEAFANVSCFGIEREALLKFRQGLIDHSKRLSSWTSKDCCEWKGVQCSKKTGHVFKLDLRNPCLEKDHFGDIIGSDQCSLAGKIHASLAKLKHLKYLDLSLNKFSKQKIPQFFGILQRLEYLNLSSAGFNGNIPHHLGNLSNLQYLDLASEFGEGYLTSDNLQWVSKLSSLKYFHLSSIDLGKAKDWFSSINMLSSLQSLQLKVCSLEKLPHSLSINFTSLRFLDLSDNSINSTIPPWFYNFSKLEHINLSENQLKGAFPRTLFDNNQQLSFLDVSDNWLGGEILKNFSSLYKLHELTLSFNNFDGDVGNIIHGPLELAQSNLRICDFAANNFIGFLPSQLESFKDLEYLSLSQNSILGPIPVTLGELSSLRELDLSQNSIWGPIPVTLGELSSLRELLLGNNKLSGNIPESIGRLFRLEILDISNNSLSGVVSESHFANLTSLTYLDISSNELVLSFDPTWVPPFQVQQIYMSGCDVGPKFPPWLQTQRNISVLYMSNANISDEVPNWLSDILLNAKVLDLTNNMLRGPISRMDGNKMRQLKHLLLSGNSLSGSIPNSLCAMGNLLFLDLSENQLSGTLPLCLKNLEALEWILLRDNRLSGQITNSFCHMKQLEALILHKNGFDQVLPKCLSNLTDLLALDLSDNDFTGEIPPFGHLQLLVFINLENNSFTGGIPSQFCQLNNLQYLSLAQNNISGSIPSCFNGLSTMVGDINHFPLWYLVPFVHVTVNTKGTSRIYDKTLQLFHSIDLSANNLNGEIPYELTRLVKLQNLNLSQNNLSGKIPSNIGDLKNLESLDLSNNGISGRIPSIISSLDFLSCLNLSFNNLSGPIPSGLHLRTMDDESVYRGNDGLCGAPLLKVCPGDEQHPNIGGRDGDFRNGGEPNEGNLDIHNWFYAGLGPGFTIGFLGFCSALHFKRSWRISYFQAMDRIIEKLMISRTMITLRFKRAFQER